MGTRSFRTLAALVVGVLLLWAGWQLTHRGPRVGSADRGKTVYVDLQCSACHGNVGQGGGSSGGHSSDGGPKLVPNPFPLEAFTQQLRKPRLNMPIYDEDRADDQDIADIHAYLLSIEPGR